MKRRLLIVAAVIFLMLGALSVGAAPKAYPPVGAADDLLPRACTDVGDSQICGPPGVPTPPLVRCLPYTYPLIVNGHVVIPAGHAICGVIIGLPPPPS